MSNSDPLASVLRARALERTGVLDGSFALDGIVADLHGHLGASGVWAAFVPAGEMPPSSIEIAGDPPEGLSPDFWSLPVRLGRRIIVEDTTDHQDLPAVNGFGAWLCFPIRSLQGVLGCICVVSRDSRAWTPRELGRTERVRDRIEAEIERRLLHDRADSLDVWNETRRMALIGALDGVAPGGLTASLTRALAEVLHARGVQLRVADRWDARGVLSVCTGLSESIAARLRERADGPAVEALSSGRTRVWRGEPGVWGSDEDALREGGCGASITLPVQGSGAETIASLTIHVTDSDALDAIEGDVLTDACEVVRSIVEHTRAARIARAAEERLSLAISSSRDGFFDYDAVAERLIVGQRWCEIVGVDPDQLTYTLDDWARYLDPRDADWVGRAFQTTLSPDGPPFDAEYRVRTAEGDPRWIHAKGKVIGRSANGAPMRMVGTFADTTEQRDRATELDRLSAAISQLNDAVVITDAAVDMQDDPTIRFVNPAVYRILGIEAPDLIGRTTAELFGQVEGDLEALVAARHRLLEGEPVRNVFKFAHANGVGHVWVEVHTQPIADPVEPYWVSVARDVTDRIRAEEELLESRDQLRHAQKMEAVGRLAGGMAHDFNNLLTAILGYAEFIKDEPLADTAIREDADEIVQAAARGQAITRQLLAFSRNTSWNPEPISPSTLIDGIDRLVDRLLGEDVRLDIVPGPSEARVIADRHQLEQALVNLAINARDALPRGGTVTISTEGVELSEPVDRSPETVPAGAWEVIRVHDDGVGIPPALVGHIFEPFFTTKEAGKGTGLGLATVYGTVKQCDGYVTVDSVPGEGTSFRIFLPRADVGAIAAQEIERGDTPAGGDETILVVEDELQVRNFTVRMLQRVGYRTIEAKHGRDALLVFERHGGDIDLVLTDVLMPEMDGIELAKELSNRAPRLPILYMSGYTGGTTGDGDRDRTIPPRDLIAKPFSMPDLLRRVRDRLDD